MARDSRPTIHLIGNAHLDPVWLWDWREGLTEAIITTRTVLDLMDERPELTFIRGESLLYEHIERHDPVSFRRIREHVRSGRWDVVGGTYLQSDENLPSAATLIAQFERGQRYFRDRFGRSVSAAWSPDAYGHSAGYPEILAASGIRSFAFTRPSAAHFALEKPAFHWRARSGASVLAYRMSSGWYGSERDEIPRRLEASLAEARSSGLHHVACLYGLGNHGGGPTRRHLDDIQSWAGAHPEVRVLHSGLHSFFEALGREASELPVVEGELNFSLRGTYVSHARCKRAYRLAESELERAEHVTAAVGAALSIAPDLLDLRAARDGVLFNSFHDIVTGSSTERVMEEQTAWLGGSLQNSQSATLAALTALSHRLDTTVPQRAADEPAPVPILVFNPRAQAYRGSLELEANLDYRPLFSWRGRPTEIPLEVRDARLKPIPFQLVAPEHRYAFDVPWRMRLLVQGTVPPLGYAVFTVGLSERRSAVQRRSGAVAMGERTIHGSGYTVSARVGDGGVRIGHNGKLLLRGEGLSVVTVADPWGSEGGMNEEPESIRLDRVLQRWRISAIRLLERGPIRSALWVRLRGGSSSLELTFRLTRGRPVVDVAARVLWYERSARMKLVLDWPGEAEYEVPGGSVARGNVGEVPALRWVRVRGARGVLGFASDVLYGFDCTGKGLGVSVVRATRYGTDASEEAGEAPWHPVGDAGELRFRFLISEGGRQLERLAAELDRPPVTLPVPAHPGPLGREGSFGELSGAGLRLLRLERGEDGQVRAWVQGVGGATGGSLSWLGRRYRIALPRGRIRCINLAGARPVRQRL